MRLGKTGLFDGFSQGPAMNLARGLGAELGQIGKPPVDVSDPGFFEKAANNQGRRGNAAQAAELMAYSEQMKAQQQEGELAKMQQMALIKLLDGLDIDPAQKAALSAGIQSGQIKTPNDIQAQIQGGPRGAAAATDQLGRQRTTLAAKAKEMGMPGYAEIILQSDSPGNVFQKALEERQKLKVENLKEGGRNKREQAKAAAEKAEKDAKMTAEQQALSAEEQGRLRSSLTTIDNQLVTIEEVEEMIEGGDGTGWATLWSRLPNTDAKTLANKVKTLQSELAFTRLQKMRDESKTGGALGQVSNIELELLKSAISALDPSDSDFANQVAKVRKHYENFRATLAGEMPDIDWSYYEQRGMAKEIDGTRYVKDPATGQWFY